MDGQFFGDPSDFTDVQLVHSTRPGKRLQKTNWKDPPCEKWENPLFHIFNSYVKLPEGTFYLLLLNR